MILDPYVTPAEPLAKPSYKNLLHYHAKGGTDFDTFVNMCVADCSSLKDTDSEKRKPYVAFLTESSGIEQELNQQIAHFVSGKRYTRVIHTLSNYLAPLASCVPSFLDLPENVSDGALIAGVISVGLGFANTWRVNRKASRKFEHARGIVQDNFAARSYNTIDEAVRE